MSWYSTEDARWFYDLFSGVRPYEEIYYRSYIALIGLGYTYDQTRDLLASLLKNGAKYANCEIVNENVFRCNNTYIEVATPPSSYCGDVTEVGFEFTWFHVFTCLNKIILNVLGQQIVFTRIFYGGEEKDGRRRLIVVELYIPKHKQSTRFLVFATPERLSLEFAEPEEAEIMERAGLTPHEVLSVFFRDESAKATVEGGIRRIVNILPKVLLSVAVYFLY